MPTYQRAPKSVEDLAQSLLKKHDYHKALLESGATIDILFAYGDVDEQGTRVGDAITVRGRRAYGQARKINLKDRAAGREDCEVLLDHEFWEDATEEQQAAVLDHELYHFEPKIDKRGLVKDDLGRPVIKLRMHDVEVGWFDCIAKAHGAASIEQQQAAKIMDHVGQLYWPEISDEIREKAAHISQSRFTRVAHASGK